MMVILSVPDDDGYYECMMVILSVPDDGYSECT